MPKFDELSRSAENTAQNSVAEEAKAVGLTFRTTNQNDFKSEEISSLKVSKRTAQYVHLMDCVNYLWGEIEKALENDYSSEYSESIFDKDFHKPLDQIRDNIEDYLISSIRDSMGNSSKTDVL